MEIKDIIKTLEKLAPLHYQEQYDNSGLLCGSIHWHVDRVLCTLDCTEEIVEEAIDKGCQMIISHHPILFKPIKSLTGKTYVERTLIKAIQAKVAIYAIHTNLDHVARGVNLKLGQKLGLTDLRILAPKHGILLKLITYAPEVAAERVRQALFDAGSGEIGNYVNCSFNSLGEGTFKATESANPTIGEVGKIHREKEVKIEVLVETHLLQTVIRALKDAHPYEEVAYDIVSLENPHQNIGAGMIGKLPKPLSIDSLLAHVAKTLMVKVIKHTSTGTNKVQNIAICGGSGSSLLKEALRAEADVYISADFKYHEYFDAEKAIVIMDVGHFESEQFTPELLKEYLEENFSTFAVLLSEVQTNPVQYYIS